MTIYAYIEVANTMRQNGSPFRRSPKHRPKFEDAWGKLWGFRVKHPDSTRTRKAKQAAKDLRAYRADCARVEAGL